MKSKWFYLKTKYYKNIDLTGLFIFVTYEEKPTSLVLAYYFKGKNRYQAIKQAKKFLKQEIDKL